MNSLSSKTRNELQINVVDNNQLISGCW